PAVSIGIGRVESRTGSVGVEEIRWIGVKQITHGQRSLEAAQPRAGDLCKRVPQSQIDRKVGLYVCNRCGQRVVIGILVVEPARKIPACARPGRAGSQSECLRLKLCVSDADRPDGAARLLVQAEQEGRIGAKAQATPSEGDV